MHKAFAIAAAIPWAMDEAWLRTVLEVANREGRGPEAVAAEVGRPLDNTQSVAMYDGVAVLSVDGPIFRKANLFTEVSGATSIDILARDFRAAMADPDVAGIVLNIDSPGGTIAGVHEFAEMVYAARGVKPVVAYVDGTAASAAYWIASACDKVVADATAVVGSIGVVQAVPNPNAEENAATIEIVSSQSPDKRPDVTTKGGRAVVQAHVDSLADVFIGDVARNRGVTSKQVVSQFGRGGVMVGAEAQAAGLVDQVASFDSTLAMVRDRASSKPKGKARMSAPSALVVALATVFALAPSASEDEVISAARDAQLARADRDALVKATGAKDPVSALDRIGEMNRDVAELAKVKAEADAAREKAKAMEVDALVASAKSANKLTPKLEEQVRALAKGSIDSARALVDALQPIAALAKASQEPEGENTTLAMKYEGKTYEQMTYDEKANLEASQPEVFDRMRADWKRRGEPRRD